MPSVVASVRSTDIWWAMYMMIFEVDIVSNTGFYSNFDLQIF